MTTRKRRVITQVPEKQILTIEDGNVVMNVIPEVVTEVELSEEIQGDGKPRIKFTTPSGEAAVYEYVGDCADCLSKKPPETTPVFTCKSGRVRADEQLGNQLASFRRDGHSASCLCKDCYKVWRGQQTKMETRYRVL